MNILWQQPNKTLALTSVFADSLTRMARAASLADLAAQRDEIAAQRDEIDAQLVTLREQSEAVLPEYPAFPEQSPDETEANFELRVSAFNAAIEAENARVSVACGAIQESIAAVESELSTVCGLITNIQYHDNIKENEGLSIEEHSTLLQLRGDVPADWIMVAINVEWSETGWKHESHRWNGSAVVVDFVAAQAETKARLRAERTPMLLALDVQFQRNLETGADNAATVAEKNRLRDITMLVDAAATLGELKLIACDE